MHCPGILFQKPSEKMMFVVIFMISLLHPVIAGLTDDVCTEVRNPGFCTTVVTNDPRSVTANLATLALIVMDEMLQNLSAFNNKLNNLGKENKNPLVGEILIQCIALYAAAYADMTEVANDMLTFKNYDVFSSKAFAVVNRVYVCESAFLVTNSSSPSPVAAETQVVQDYADILELIWSRLKAQNSSPPPSSSSNGGDGISIIQNMTVLVVIISAVVVRYLGAQLYSGFVGNTI